MANKKTSHVANEKGVIYARYSSSGQREESIEGQLRECRAYAERFGITIVGEYCDYALTGTNDKRPEFQRMIRDSAKGQFTVAILWKIDRFSRSKYDSAIYKHKLKQNGVRVLYAKETIPEGPEGIIFESLMEGFAEYYSANLSQNVKRGFYDSALKLQTLGQIVYGLQRGTDGKWEINPSQAPIVKRIFEEYTSGKSAVEIYKNLNAEGYRTLTNKPFNKNSIRRIIKNEKYCGVYQYADIRVEDGIPAIISKEMYQDAQRILQMHHEKPAAKKLDGGFLLSGKLFCGHCGEPMTGDCGTSRHGNIYKYYTCKNRRIQKCDKKRESKDCIEEAIVTRLVSIVHNDSIINKFADCFMEWQANQKNTSLKAELESRLKKVNASLKNAMAAIDSGFITDTLKSHIMELESEREQIEYGIAKEAIGSPHIKRSEIIYFLQKFRDGDVNDISYRIYLVETFLQSAYLYDDGRLILHLNYSGKDNKITLQTAEQATTEGEPLCSYFASSAPP